MNTHTHTHTHTHGRAKFKLIFTLLFFLLIRVSSIAQIRCPQHVLHINWGAYSLDGQNMDYLDNMHDDITHLLTSSDEFNFTDPQVVYEFPSLYKCDCIHQIYTTCSGNVMDADLEVYNNSFSYLYTIEDVFANSYEPGEGCFDFPTDGIYYMKILEHTGGVTIPYGWYKITINTHADIDDIIDVSVSNTEICRGKQVCVNISNVNFRYTCNITWNNTFLTSGSIVPPSSSFNYCFTPQTFGTGVLTVNSSDDCGDFAVFTQQINVKAFTDFALPTPVCAGTAVNVGTITWCNGAVSGASYTWNWGDGSTSSTTQSASHIYSNPGTYNVTLTVSSASGTQSMTKQIIVNPLPNNVTVTGARHTCAGQSAYTIINPQQGTTYSWSIYPPNCGSLSSNSGTSVNITWNPDNFPSENYVSIIVTSNNGCTNRDTIKVWKCCWREAPENVPLVKYDQVFSGPLYEPVYFLNGVIEFQGTNTYDNITFHIGPEAKIIINNNANTTFNNCKFLAECNYMWEGIIVEQGSWITVNGSQTGSSSIEDAVNGIRSVNGARFTVYNTTFNRNLDGINVQTYTGTHTGTVSKCTFSSLLNSNPANLLPPYSNRRGETGIIISGVNSIQIGNTASTTNQNIYKYMDYGVKIENSNVTLYNNSFGPMPNTAGSSMPENGYGIYAINGNVNGNTINIGNTSTNTVYANAFTDCAIGVYAVNNYNINIYRNTFTSPTQIMRFGTFMMEHGYRTINISNNKFTNPTAIGIWALNIPYTSINIDDNKFYNNIAGANETQMNIAVNNIVLSKITSVNIRGNYMYNDRTNGLFQTGILLSNLEGYTDLALNKHYPFVFGNTISYSTAINIIDVSTKRCGIRVENCRNANVEQNTISCAKVINNDLQNASIASRLTGIYVITSPNTVLCKNVVDHRGFGIQFDGNSSSSKIIKNDLTNNFYGYEFSSATIGNQNSNNSPHDNKWIGFATAQRRAHGSLAASSNWLYRTSNTDYRLQNPYDYINVSNLSSSSSNPTFYNDCAYTPGSGGTSMMAGNPNMNTDTQETEYFIDEVENEYYDKFNNEGMLMNVNQLNSENVFVGDVYLNIPIFKSVNEYLSSRDFVKADSINSSIIPKNIIEHNMQIVNDIYLRTWAKGNWNIPSNDYFTLIDIALQSPITSGYGVVSAWIMTQRFDNTNDMVESQKASINIKQNSNIVISPNPAKDQIQIDGIEQISKIVVYDLFGREMFTKFNDEKNSIIINISSLKNGIYFVQFTNKFNGDVLVEKIVIL